MRILRVVSDLYPMVVGGIGIHAHEMSKIQSEKGNDVTVITFNSKKSPEPQRNDYRIITIPVSLRVRGNSFSFFLPFRVWTEVGSADIVHAHSHLFFSTNICALVRKFDTTPLVITNHGLMSASASDWFNILYLKTIGRWTLNTADKILCYTDEEKDKLIRILHIDELKITVIPNGIDTDTFCPRVTDQDPDTITLLWVGRFVKGKGVEYVIRAMAVLSKEIPNLNLTLVGEGPEKKRICELINDLGLQDNIRIIDFVPYDKIPGIYQDSDIFVLPSLHEGMPRTVLEAMSCGVPVVISDFSHLRDLVDGGGLMFPKRDVQALSDCLRNIIKDTSIRAEMGQKARDKIVQEHSFMRTVVGTLEVYQEVIAHVN